MALGVNPKLHQQGHARMDVPSRIVVLMKLGHILLNRPTQLSIANMVYCLRADEIVL